MAEVAKRDTHDGSAVIHWWLAVPLDAAPARLANPEHSALAWVSLAEMRVLDPVFHENIAIFERMAAARPVPASGD
jgi:hypothetical protein